MIAFLFGGNPIWNRFGEKFFELQVVRCDNIAVPKFAQRNCVGGSSQGTRQLQVGNGQFTAAKGSRYNEASDQKLWQKHVGCVMPKIERDGVKIHYEIHGDGPSLILTHGYSSTSAMWQGQIAALSKHHKLILWDMRGHGQSDYPENPAAYSEALTVGDIAALLDTAGADKAIVGGLSLGGYMSLAFYRAHPERVSALLIIDTGPGFKKDGAREVWNKRALDTAERFERDGLDVLKSASRERSTVSHRDASGLAGAARGMLTQRDARVIEVLPEIKVPSLVVVGADDTPFLAASDYMAAKIPGARKVVIPAAGHAVNIDQPQAFIDAVLPFLDGLPRNTSETASRRTAGLA
jgi:pimeloyl-ACP methyl ester carboxylesterase